jgi:hypothetical protein
MRVSRIVWLLSTWSMAFSAALFLAPSNARADASVCGSWASVSGWKGSYTLTGSGTINYAGGATATVNYSSSATLHLTTPGSQACPSSMLQWEGRMDASNATGSASYRLTAPCKDGGTATESWSTSQVSSDSWADLIVDPSQGTLIFSPLLLSTPVTITAVGCQSSATAALPGVTFTPVLPSQMPKFALHPQPSVIPVSNKTFSSLDGQTGITVNWTLSFTLTPDCDVPTGELTTWDGWNTTFGQWKQTLVSGTGSSFAGLTVREMDAGGGVDSCYFKGSAVAEQTGLTGGSWEVQDDNTWGDDDVGWGPGAVTYYQLLQPRAPCGFTFHQQMQIACYDGSEQNYGPVNTLEGLIGENDITSMRAGHSASRRTN